MGRCLFHLQRDLLLESWSVRIQEVDVNQQLRMDLRTTPFSIAENSVQDCIE